MTTPPASTIHDIAAAWAGRSAFAIVDLDALALNVETLRTYVGSGVQLMAVVKANGYGHGAVPIARAAIGAGASSLGVATVDEGAQLRRAGIDAPILVFGAVGRNERAQAIGHRLGLVVTNQDFARALASDAKASLTKEPVPVHLKIDTGMRRFGALPSDVPDLVRTIASLKELRLDGIMTHLASADADDPASVTGQVADFDRCLEALAAAGLDVPMRHLANSAGTLRFPEYHRDMVRVGIAMYGLVPDASIPLSHPMRPVLTVHGRVTRVFDLAPGDQVGYGGTYRAAGNERAALIPIGYADGYRRALSSRGWMSIRGQRADVIGRVSMDQTVIRVPDGLAIEPGEPVVIAGDRTPAIPVAPTLDDLAALIDTIGYELASGLAPRLPRLYVRNGEPVAIADLHGHRDLA
ncbi:MAG: alanine racemase [Chloroflexota bacterium]|nr:alanine racemase [Chloroflexota bacterium]